MTTDIKIPDSLPWAFVGNSWQYTTIYDDAAEQSIARLDLEDWGVTEDNQDELETLQHDVSAYIVHAANHYPALVEALKKVIAKDRVFGLTDGSGEREVWHDGPAGAIARAALQAAGVKV